MPAMTVEIPDVLAAFIDLAEHARDRGFSRNLSPADTAPRGHLCSGAPRYGQNYSTWRLPRASGPDPRADSAERP